MATIQSAPLALRFFFACSTTFSVSAAKPMTSGGRLPGRSTGDGSQDVRVLDKLEAGHTLAALLDLLVTPALATRQSATAAAKMAMSAGRAARTASSISRAVSHIDDLDPGRRRHLGRTGDKRDASAQRRGLGGDGRALLARGPIGDVAHGIDGLVRGTAGDEHVAAGKRAANVLRRCSGIPPTLTLPRKGGGDAQ